MIIGYCRISKRGRNDGISLSRQKEMIQSYVTFKNLQGELVFLQDASVSGFKSNRKSFQELLRLCKTGKVSHVIVYDLSRLARNVKLTLETIEVLEKHKVVFTSLTENISTDSAIGKCFLVICSAFAQMLRDQVSEKMSDLHAFNKKNGIAGPGFIEFGKRIEGNKIINDESEGKVIELIQALRAKAQTYKQIASHLRINGFVGKRNGKWAASTVRKIYLRTAKAV